MSFITGRHRRRTPDKWIVGIRINKGTTLSQGSEPHSPVFAFPYFGNRIGSDFFQITVEKDARPSGPGHAFPVKEKPSGLRSGWDARPQTFTHSFAARLVPEPIRFGRK